MNPVRLVFPARVTVGTWLFGHVPAAWPIAALLLLAALGAAFAVGWESWDKRQQTRTVQNATFALRFQGSQAARQSVRDEDTPALTPQQRRDWNQVTRHLNTPWPAIMDALENTTPDTIALVAIEPDPPRGSVRLQVEAKTLDTLLGYAAALKAAGQFEEVVLLKHETNEQDATRPIRLSLQVHLRAARPASGGRAEGMR